VGKSHFVLFLTPDHRSHLGFSWKFHPFVVMLLVGWEIIGCYASFFFVYALLFSFFVTNNDALSPMLQ
jgi:hypothetical protein